jgi:aarF domain-containing kinase
MLCIGPIALSSFVGVPLASPPPAFAFTTFTAERGATVLACAARVREVPYDEAAYDPSAAKEFFLARPLAPLRRLAQIASLSGGFVASVALDKALGREDHSEVIAARSQQLLEVVTDLGATFVKIGQALSIRTDILPAPYVAGLTELQDAVAPFSADEGRAIIAKELGVCLNDAFSEFSSDPVASASIGQVYRARLRKAPDGSGGHEVAIKVQRPNVLYDVSLDLFVLREILVPLYNKINPTSNTDAARLVDAWGEGFINELDYRKEATATSQFAAAMEERGLGSVTAPEVLDHLSSMHVLTSRWVEGERLASSSADDVPRLCAVALNAYLTMLLDTGVLHCDPHPGNLLRTTDGKLCILDWGMTLAVPTDLQLSLVEFIANLQAEAYDRVPDDLVKLGFVPAERLAELRRSGMTYGIARMLKIAASGGGPKGSMDRLVAENKERYGAELMAKYGTLDSPEATKERQRRFREDWQEEMAQDALSRGGGGGGAPSAAVELTQKIEQLQQENSNVFAIPDYFVYMSRAFATLEGIGLSADPSYGIIRECFPYLAKRLLSDDSPRARSALRTLLYGTGDQLDLSRLRDVASGFESYTASTSSVASSRGEGDGGRSAAVEQLAAVVLAEEGNYVQSLLLDEMAASLDAAVRSTLSSTSGPSGSPPLLSPPRLPTLPTLPVPLAPLLTPFTRPLTLPLEVARAAVELGEIDEQDAKRLENLKVLAELADRMVPLQQQPRQQPGRRGVGGTGGGAAGGMSAIAREAAARREALTRIGLRFGSALATTQAERLRRRSRQSDQHKLTEIARQVAQESAERLEGVASSFSSLDKRLASRGGTETASTKGAAALGPARALLQLAEAVDPDR